MIDHSNKGRNTSDKSIVNLSSHLQLTREHTNLLKKGLTFIPTSTIFPNHRQLTESSIQGYNRRLKIAAYFGETPKGPVPKFQDPSLWEPREQYTENKRIQTFTHQEFFKKDQDVDPTTIKSEQLQLRLCHHMQKMSMTIHCTNIVITSSMDIRLTLRWSNISSNMGFRIFTSNLWKTKLLGPLRKDKQLKEDGLIFSTPEHHKDLNPTENDHLGPAGPAGLRPPRPGPQALLRADLAPQQRQDWPDGGSVIWLERGLLRLTEVSWLPPFQWRGCQYKAGLQWGVQIHNLSHCRHGGSVAWLRRGRSLWAGIRDRLGLWARFRAWWGLWVGLQDRQGLRVCGLRALVLRRCFGRIWRLSSVRIGQTGCPPCDLASFPSRISGDGDGVRRLGRGLWAGFQDGLILWILGRSFPLLYCRHGGDGDGVRRLGRGLWAGFQDGLILWILGRSFPLLYCRHRASLVPIQWSRALTSEPMADSCCPLL
ncbi:unnamed protein product [Menidia menidia]|uniref:(Atlantic silverside) hypothetical protein n=1 Tax=Menidia menidia TaxID=238744 RepID=A0A8S4AL78_9TELE|nr:unnamed protein product [Menidia menidia]